jgi:hypothetical protein
MLLYSLVSNEISDNMVHFILLRDLLASALL